MEANLVWSHANLLHGLARLYETHKAVLQNSCAPPGMGEGFMFQNYTDLVAQLSLSDKAGLVTLLPDVFYWGEAEDHHDSTSTVPERALLAKLPKESHGTNGLREWLPNIDFTSDTTPSPSTCADSSISDPNATRSKSNAEAHVSDKYQETLTGGILLEILKANAKTGILPKSFGPLPTIDEGDIGTCRQGESGKLRVNLAVLKALAEDAQKLGKDFYSFSLGIQSFAVILPRHMIPEVECPGFAVTFRRDEE
ncbi:hypothetical protein BGZ57DRAFT_906933 [Hyaloscypha finlandica]|nr:hypothetical protein BGZ57DRAFT_906933 [Hyaloscypha finlandica]